MTKNSDGFSTTPRTKDLAELVDAIEMVGAELHYQITRLESQVTADTEEEHSHLGGLLRGYKGASEYLGIFRNYQDARLKRQRGEAPAREPRSRVPALDPSGFSGPVFGEDGP